MNISKVYPKVKKNPLGIEKNLPFISFAQIRAIANHDITTTDAVDDIWFKQLLTLGAVNLLILFRLISTGQMIIVNTFYHMTITQVNMVAYY